MADDLIVTESVVVQNVTTEREVFVTVETPEVTVVSVGADTEIVGTETVVIQNISTDNDVFVSVEQTEIQVVSAGEQGPPGAQGLQGPAGASGSATLYSYQNKDVVTLWRCLPVYLDQPGQVKRARSDSVSTRNVIGIANDTSIPVDAVGQILVSGPLVASTAEWDNATGEIGGLVPGAVYYLAANTSGAMTRTAPSGIGESVCKLGSALNSTTFLLEIEPPILL